MSYERYLLELAQRECEERRRKRIGKLFKESGLPLEKSLANFDGKRLPVKVSRQMKMLLEGGFLDRKENLLIFGNPGAGKSHLLCAIAQELIATRGRKIKYATCPLLVQDLLAAKRDLRLGKEIKKLATVSSSTRWGTCSKVERKWRSCSPCWRSVMNAAAFC